MDHANIADAVTLLVARYMEHSEVKVVSYRRHSFQSREDSKESTESIPDTKERQ